MVINIEMDPLEIGASTVLNNIFFEVNSATLNDKSETEILEIVQFLENNNTTSIVIEGHTDTTGSEAYNLELSLKRAKAVREDLILRGIDSNRLSATGFGFSKPVADNDTESGRSQNRRIEFRIIE